MTHLLSLNMTRNRAAVAVEGSKSTTSRSVQASGSLNSGKNGVPWSLKATSVRVRSLVLTMAAPVSSRATATKLKVFHVSFMGLVFLEIGHADVGYAVACAVLGERGASAPCPAAGFGRQGVLPIYLPVPMNPRLL